MSQVHSMPAKAGRFAVYCGAGLYLSFFSQSVRRESVHLGAKGEAARLSREAAIAACHAARRAGQSAWVVGVPA